jgi:hypothetical protein
MNNIMQYGTIFAAYGCKFNYDSEVVALDIVDGSDIYVEAALKDIAHFDDTTNYLDGAAALALADMIDGLPNPLSISVRRNILEALHITKDNNFIYQVLSLQKNNRSWHYSDTANSCNWFGDVCVTRGINPDPNRKGRTSSRVPEQYHVTNTKGAITREQLVTPALERIFSSIPKDKMISGARYTDIDASVKKLKLLSLDQRLKVISQLQEV